MCIYLFHYHFKFHGIKINSVIASLHTKILNGKKHMQKYCCPYYVCNLAPFNWNLNKSVLGKSGPMSTFVSLRFSGPKRNKKIQNDFKKKEIPLNTSQYLWITTKIILLDYPWLSINLQVRWRGSIPPIIDLVCDHSAAERAALVLVEPKSNAFVTEYVLHKRKATVCQIVPYLIQVFRLWNRMLWLLLLGPDHERASYFYHLSLYIYTDNT